MPDAPPSYEQSTGTAGGFYPPNVMYSPQNVTYPPLPLAEADMKGQPVQPPIVTTRTQVNKQYTLMEERSETDFEAINELSFYFGNFACEYSVNVSQYHNHVHTNIIYLALL